MEDLQFAQTLRRYGMDTLLAEASAVLVGFSGGADSSCLLHLLNKTMEGTNTRLFAAHVHHGIRGEEADRDEAFCRAECEKLGIPLYVRRVDVPALAQESGRGLEETARDVRYQFFHEIAQELSTPDHPALIATAHNADDNLETVLFHLLRGSGTHGLCGITPIRDGRILRPLIADDAASIRRWCEENGIPYVTDSTNGDTDYTRNLIRNRIVPPMREIVPNPAAAVSRLTSLLRMDDAYLEAEARSYWQPGSRVVSRRLLKQLSPAISTRILRMFLDEASDGEASPGEKHIRQLLDLAVSEKTGFSCPLPGSIPVVGTRNELRIRRESDKSENLPEKSFRYPEDGAVFRNELCAVYFSQSDHSHHREIVGDDENIYKLSIPMSFRFDTISNGVQIRSRCPGDAYRFGGMTRRIKKLFIEKKLSQTEKALLPILCDASGILWIPGFPPRDGTAYQPGDTGPRLDVICRFYDAIPLI